MRVLSRPMAATAILMALLASTSLASSEEPETPGDPAKGESTHEGLQLRVGLGGGYLRDDMSGLFDVEGVAQGPSGAFQASAAWAVTTDFFIGGGISTDTVTDPKMEFEDVDVESDIRIGTLTLFGAYLNYYFTDSFHVYGTVGAAKIATKDDEGQVDDETASGFGLSGGLGYDMWIADDFTVGAAARVTNAGLFGDGLLTHSVNAFSLMLMGTYD